MEPMIWMVVGIALYFALAYAIGWLSGKKDRDYEARYGDGNDSSEDCDE